MFKRESKGEKYGGHFDLNWLISRYYRHKRVQLIFLSNICRLNNSIDYIVNKLLYSSQLLDLCIQLYYIS